MCTALDFERTAGFVDFRRGIVLFCGALRALSAELAALDFERHCALYGIGL